MIPVLQLKSIKQTIKSNDDSQQDYEVVFDAELMALKNIQLVPNTQCLEQLFEKLGLVEKAMQR